MNARHTVHVVIERKLPVQMPGKPAECLETELSLMSQPDDIYIVTFPKTGTTLLQYTCHLLRTNGLDEKFEDIHQVSPQISSSWFIGQDLNDPSQIHNSFVPRLFKSHRELQQVAAFESSARYIVTIRDPLHTLYSMHSFRSQRGSTSMSVLDFAHSNLWTKSKVEGCVGTIFETFATFWKCRDCSNILILPYEDLVASPALLIPVIATFMKLPCDPQLVDLIVLKTSREAMLSNVHKFDESWCAQRMLDLHRSNPNIGYKVSPKVNAVDSLSASSTPNSSSSAAEMTDEEVRHEVCRLQSLEWQQRVFPLTGLTDYEAMRNQLLLLLLK